MSTTPAPAGDEGDIAAGTHQPPPSQNPRDFYNPITPTQRQQRTIPPRSATATPASDDASLTASSHRTLRRTPRFQAARSPSPTPRPSRSSRRIHLEAASVGIAPQPIFATAGPPGLGQPPQPHGSFRQRPLQDSSDDLNEDTFPPQPSFIPERTSSLSHSNPLRLSRHTKSAILWALEEALRQPYSFSPDLNEENASMADLLSGGVGPATSNGHAVPSPRPTVPSQTGSPQQVIRGPRMIMRERAEREARQKAEREQVERARAEEEARMLEETRRQNAERRNAAAGAAPGGNIATDPATQRRQKRAQDAQGGPQVQPGNPPQADVPQPLRPARTGQPNQAPQGFTPAAGTGGTAPGQPAEPSAPNAGTRMKNSFPHAFERWEALSAHWEGMTSFWIRKLQENTDEFDRNPISAQLSRQVSDLSAAGANLFHAVVELQRLRASSERKFQRWFFETRSDIERLQETNAMLENALEEERRSRTEAARQAQEQERENAKTQKLLAEMRKELLISKDEARRAWEELGRREQEERDRTLSLQQGHPTIVGGVQVVPMTQGVPNRQASTRDHQRTQSDTSDYVAAPNPQYPQYTQGSASQPNTTAAAQPSGAYYQQQPGTSTQQPGDYGAGSGAGYDEGELHWRY